jgi:hypothetical protein
VAIETFKEQRQALAGWPERLPSPVVEALPDVDPFVTFGDRHGSWVLRIAWVQAELIRIAGLAITNSEATPDELTNNAVVTIRSSASTEERYVVETLFERRRAISRLPAGFLVDQLATAVRRAGSFTSVNLTASYLTGGGNDLAAK